MWQGVAGFVSHKSRIDKLPQITINTPLGITNYAECVRNTSDHARHMKTLRAM